MATFNLKSRQAAMFAEMRANAALVAGDAPAAREAITELESALMTRWVDRKAHEAACARLKVLQAQAQEQPTP